MQRYFLGILLLFSVQIHSQTFSTSAQDSDELDSPYELNWAIDGPWLGAGLGLTVYGNSLIRNKDPLTDAELAGKSKDDVLGIDRWAAGNYSESADKLSYVPFYASFAAPLLLLLNENERQHAGQLGVIYLETMATTGALWTITAGLVDRSRPLVYNTELPSSERKNNAAQRSFFAGHVAAAGAATFFLAKVYSDFNPDSWARPYVWTAAALVPVWVGYLRLEGGKHFLTDNIVGYAVGALTGILIPELHKKKNEHIDVTPSMGYDALGNDYQGISFRYRF